MIQISENIIQELRAELPYLEPVPFESTCPSHKKYKSKYQYDISTSLKGLVGEVRFLQTGGRNARIKQWNYVGVIFQPNQPNQYLIGGPVKSLADARLHCLCTVEELLNIWR